MRTAPPRITARDSRRVKPAGVARSDKRAAPFYTSPEWRALMRELIAERGRRCEARGCGRVDCTIFGDHIVELQDGGAPLDKRNVQLFCGSCHTTKTLAERARRLRE